MSRYSRSRTSPRSRSRSRSYSRPGSSSIHPVVLFLLVVAFGSFFVAGCGRIAGPSGDETFEDTFTAEDVATFQDAEVGSAVSADATGTGADVGSSAAVVSLTGTGTVSEAGADPALIKQYAALRADTPAGAQATYRVTNTFLNVRAQPATSSASVGRFNLGDAVSVLGFTNASWAKVDLGGGKQGYVSAQYIAKVVNEEQLAQEQKAFEGVSFVDFRFVNVRGAPDSASPKIGEIPGQTFVSPLGIQGDWARVMFDGKEAYVAKQFLSPFQPNFLVRQGTFALPVLHYRVTDTALLTTLTRHAVRLRKEGFSFMTLRDFSELLLTQERRDVRLNPQSVVIAVSGVTPQNARAISDALYAENIPATLFIEGKNVGLSGITQKTLMTLQANGFDVQSAGHTGDDLRALTNAQVRLELEQSRALLEDLTNRTVFAVLYPQGGQNDRVSQAAANAGYLLGIGSTPGKSFTRSQFLNVPSIAVSAGMTEEEVLKLVR